MPMSTERPLGVDAQGFIQAAPSGPVQLEFQAVLADVCATQIGRASCRERVS